MDVALILASKCETAAASAERESGIGNCSAALAHDDMQVD